MNYVRRRLSSSINVFNVRLEGAMGIPLQVQVLGDLMLYGPEVIVWE